MPPESARLIQLDDLSAMDIGDVVEQAQQRLGRSFTAEGVHFSRVNGTAGFPTDAGTWVRLSWRRSSRLDMRSWTGTEAAAAIRGVPRPQWLAAATWDDADRAVVWKAEETTLAPAPAVSAVAEIDTAPSLPDRWWAELKASLDTLADHTTDRMSLEQAHLSRRIHEVYGASLDTRVPDEEWRCAHGDLGYANLTGPALALLDWESWGMAPRGWDAACLWSASLGVPEVAAHVLAQFSDDLSTRAGRLCRLLLCSNTARAAKRTGRTSPLAPAMAEAAETFLGELA
ncbi:aminoglycoside phosphotransferase [Nocardiopsis rhodophaea]|uniref:aminoglycoside phosphotransferase n=1 Tax=Nocardiopsis rhodophaea TaxID=280238 RepID=UPI0031D339DA